MIDPELLDLFSASQAAQCIGIANCLNCLYGLCTMVVIVGIAALIGAVYGYTNHQKLKELLFVERYRK